jgi:hypothetical protein
MTSNGRRHGGVAPGWQWWATIAADLNLGERRCQLKTGAARGHLARHGHHVEKACRQVGLEQRDSEADRWAPRGIGFSNK